MPPPDHPGRHRPSVRLPARRAQIPGRSRPHPLGWASRSAQPGFCRVKFADIEKHSGSPGRQRRRESAAARGEKPAGVVQRARPPPVQELPSLFCLNRFTMFSVSHLSPPTIRSPLTSSIANVCCLRADISLGIRHWRDVALHSAGHPAMYLRLLGTQRFPPTVESPARLSRTPLEFTCIGACLSS